MAIVGRPDEIAGELPTAFVVKQSENVTEKELQDYVSGKCIYWCYIPECELITDIRS